MSQHISSKQIISTLKDSSSEGLLEALHALIASHLPYVVMGVSFIFLGIIYLIYRQKYRIREDAAKKNNVLIINKVLRHMGDIEVIFSNEMRDVKIILAQLQQTKIKEQLSELLERSPDNEEHHIKVEERIEQIAEIVKQNSGNKDNTQFTTATQKLNDLLEKQSLYLKEELDAISDKIQTLTTAQPSAPQSAENTTIIAHAPHNAQQNQIHPLSNSSDLLVQINEKVSALQAHSVAAASAGNTATVDNSAFFEMIAQSMNRLSSEVDAKLTLLNSKLEKNMASRWSDALVSINNLREQIQDLSQTGEQMKNISKNVTSLSRMLLTRAGIGEESGRQQLAELLPQILSSEHFQLDFDLPNGHCAAALVRFPDPRDSVAIDASISIQTFFDTMDENISASERDNKQQIFRRELANHINYVADNLIFPPHTGESALLFIPSEAAFANVHAHHRAVVQLALSRRIWLVSPTTLLAVLNTANTAIKDHQAHLQLQQLQATVSQIVEEAQHFENRLTEIGDHVNSAWRSVQRAENASGRLIGSIRNISQSRENNIPINPPTDNDTLS